MKAREAQMNTRVTDADRKRVERAAKAAGMTVSEWMRAVLIAATDRCPVCGREGDK